MFANVIMALAYTFLRPEMLKLALIFAAGFLLATYVPSTAAAVKSII